jgi:hypothetical protein
MLIAWEMRLTKFWNGVALNEAFENKQLGIKLRKSVLYICQTYRSITHLAINFSIKIPMTIPMV